MNEARIVVAGAGPVGLAFACACEGVDVLVVEPSAEPQPAGEEFDVRIFALSAGTRSFLRDIGAWERLDASRIAAVQRMEVFGDAGARLAFSGRPGLPLAWIVEADRLALALSEEAASHPHVRLRRGVAFEALEVASEGARIRLTNGESIEADLLVGADGPDSPVRTAAGLEASERSYGECALVANFVTERDHGGIARQWFRADGVLAWLPLPGRAISIVWSAPDAVAGELLSLDPVQLAERVREAGRATLGELELCSRIARFALRSIRLDRTVAPCVALVGDAGHAVHPLAGQGVNLGFQDARSLAAEIVRRSPLERPGDLRLLRRHARSRREDVTAMQFVTDGLDRLFGSSVPGLSWLRNAGLGFVDRRSSVKRALAERAMR